MPVVSLPRIICASVLVPLEDRRILFKFTHCVDLPRRFAELSNMSSSEAAREKHPADESPNIKVQCAGSGVDMAGIEVILKRNQEYLATDLQRNISTTAVASLDETTAQIQKVNVNCFNLVEAIVESLSRELCVSVEANTELKEEVDNCRQDFEHLRLVSQWFPPLQHPQYPPRGTAQLVQMISQLESALSSQRVPHQKIRRVATSKAVPTQVSSTPTWLTFPCELKGKTAASNLNEFIQRTQGVTGMTSSSSWTCLLSIGGKKPSPSNYSRQTELYRLRARAITPKIREESNMKPCQGRLQVLPAIRGSVDQWEL